MKEKFLPIGSVVLLKGATKKLMITGYCSAVPAEPNKTYDYVSCLFPEGNLAGDDVALFNHEQIEKIVYLGLDDDEFKQINAKIKSLMAEEQTPQPIVPVGPDMPPFSPENINALLNSIKAQGMPDVIKEPTAFNEENMKKPVFSPPSIDGRGKIKKENTEEEDENAISDEFSVENYEQEEKNETVNDGTPVLQLQLIGGDGMPSAPVDNSSVNGGESIAPVLPTITPVTDTTSTDSGSAPAIPGLTRL